MRIELSDPCRLSDLCDYFATVHAVARIVELALAAAAGNPVEATISEP
jgi:hypothetical protein